MRHAAMLPRQRSTTRARSLGQEGEEEQEQEEEDDDDKDDAAGEAAGEIFVSITFSCVGTGEECRPTMDAHASSGTDSVTLRSTKNSFINFNSRRSINFF